MNPNIERDYDTPIGAPIHNYWPAPPIRIPTREERNLLDKLFGISLVDLKGITEIGPKSIIPAAELKKN